MIIYATDSSHSWYCAFLVTPAEWRKKYFRELVWDRLSETLGKKPEPYTITILEGE